MPSRHPNPVRSLLLCALLLCLIWAGGCGYLESPIAGQTPREPLSDRDFFMQIAAYGGQAADWSEKLYAVCRSGLAEMAASPRQEIDVHSLMEEHGLVYDKATVYSVKTGTWPPDYQSPDLQEALLQGFSEENWQGALATAQSEDGGTLILLITADMADLSVGQIRSVAMEIWSLTNALRRQNGLADLKWDTTGARIAQAKTEEMYKYDYFEHVSPITGDLSAQFLAFGRLVWKEDIRAMGENIAMSQGYDTAEMDAAYWMDLWENSPEHLANMLNETYTHMGAAVYQGGDGRCYAAQEFLTYID